jgi:hypothetical protein
VIAVIGITGTGKSTFISHFTDEEISIGTSLNSRMCMIFPPRASTLKQVHECTNEKTETTSVQVYEVQHMGQNIYLVDTPGFDDSNRSDTDVLRDVVAWLATAYSHRVYLTGIIYLQRITDTRMQRSSMRNLRMFRKLCGDGGLASVVLATTMWDRMDEDEGSKREHELMNRHEYWKTMIENGSQVFRTDGQAESAKKIVDYLISRRSTVVLEVQREIVEEAMSLDQTAAGQAVSDEIHKQKAAFQDDLKEIEEMMKEGFQVKDTKLQEALAAEKTAIELRIRQSEEDAVKLKATKEELRRQLDARLAREWKRLLEDLRKMDAKMAEDEFKLRLRRRTEMNQETRQLELLLEQERVWKTRTEKDADELKNRGCLVM